MKTLISIIAALLFAPVLLAADPQPTADQALEFIRQKIQEADKQDGDRPSEVTLDKTIFTRINTTHGTPNRVYRLSLANCDPERTKVEIDTRTRSSKTIYWVRVSGTNDQPVSFGYEPSDPATAVTAHPTTIYKAPSLEDAERMAKAFRRLIELSGGKKSLF